MVNCFNAVPHCCTVPICPSGKVDEILGDLREAKNQKGVAVLEDTVGNTMKKVWYRPLLYNARILSRVWALGLCYSIYYIMQGLNIIQFELSYIYFKNYNF